MAAVRCDLEDFAAEMFESFAWAQVAADGVVPPVAVYFPQPWASGTPEQTARNIVQNHWWTRGDWREDNWRLLLAVFRDGQVIGQQNPSTRDVRITREARTGFWLGRRFQGRAFGTQMRAAALHLAFACLGTERVTSTASADNAASRHVSEKLGYEPNGVRRLAVDQHLVEAPTKPSSPSNGGTGSPNSPPWSKASTNASTCSASLQRPNPSTSFCTCNAGDAVHHRLHHSEVRPRQRRHRFEQGGHHAKASQQSVGQVDEAHPKRGWRPIR
ncbi:GNAT family N-acetyltransferase [Streptomyces sp. NPDC001250]|uniref:GNAT family N-acetyltransferase n=1 Tax=Streptomyces sp. NPDC001250 TaxID=3154382 RepID=UPI00331DBD64